MNWQPIETAPRDESLIIVCMPSGSHDRYYVVQWRWPEEEQNEGSAQAWRGQEDDSVLITDEQIAACHLRPMWCALIAPTTSLCAGQKA